MARTTKRTMMMTFSPKVGDFGSSVAVVLFDIFWFRYPFVAGGGGFVIVVVVLLFFSSFSFSRRWSRLRGKNRSSKGDSFLWGFSFLPNRDIDKKGLDSVCRWREPKRGGRGKIE